MKIFGFDYSQQGWYDYIMKNLYGQQKTISGNTGPIWGNTPESFGANTFFNSMESYDEGANIQYMKKNYAGVFSIDSVLGYAGTKLTHIIIETLMAEFLLTNMKKPSQADLINKQCSKLLM